MSCNNSIIDVSTAIGPRTRILLGVWDTLNVRSQTFDLTAWVNAYGAGQVIILHQRPGDELPYEVQGVTFEDGIATWTFDETDTAAAGTGAAAVVYMVGEEYIARTPGIPTYVGETVGMTGSVVPDPWESWYTRVLEASEAAQEAAAEAEAAAQTAVHQPIVGDNGNWWTWDADAGAYADTGEAAQGPQGEQGEQGEQGIPGVSPTAYVTQDEDGATITVTDGSGTTTAKILNGEVTAAQLAAVQALALAAYPTDTATGSIATFPDGADGIPVKAMTVDIEPSQDLHGYDSPWPGGGGKNKANYPGIIADGAVLQDDGSLYVATSSTLGGKIAYQNEGTEGQFAITFIVKNDVTTSRGVYPIIRYTDGTTEQIVSDTSGHLTYTTFTKVTNSAKTLDSVTFTYGSGVVKTWFYIQIEAGSTATSWTPYSNIAPISGWTGAEITRTGINIWDEQTEKGYIDHITGQDADNNSLRSVGYTRCVPGASYYLFCGSGNYVGLRFYDEYKNYVGYKTAASASNSVVVFPNNASYCRLDFLDTYGLVYNDDVSLNTPSTVTTYNAYDGTTYTVDWTDEAGTVYGGTLDPLTGALTVTRVGRDFGGILSLTYNANGFFEIYKSVLTDPGKSGTDNTLLSSVFKQVSSASTTNGEMWETNSNYRFYDDRYNDAAAFRAAYSGQYFVYPLETPQTYQLTPLQIATLLGNNNIWADCGDVSVTYRADTKLYINKMLEA